MRRAIYPGTFDPFTFGHLDIALRALKITDFLVIAVAENQNKKPKFSLSQRIEFIKSCFFDGTDEKNNNNDTANIKVIGFSGLLKDVAENVNASMIIRGLRTTGDFEYEMQLAKVNQLLMPQVETVFLSPNNSHQMISSSLVRELLFFQQDISQFVPASIVNAINLLR